MNSRELTFALKFQTTNTAAINKAAKEIQATAKAAGKVEKEAKQAAGAMTRLGLAARNAGKRFGAFARQARSAFSRLRTGAVRLGTALAAIGFAVGFTHAINVAKEFEFQMARLSAIAGTLGRETGEQFKALESVARRLGGTTQFTAGQVSNGLRLLAQAGFTAQESIAAIPGTLNLAIAATTDLGTATTITANTIRGFNLEASDAGRVADILTATTQGSNTTIEALGEALKFVAPAAASANQSIESMSAAIGTLSDAGLKGTLAGTGLRRVIVGLLNPTKAARDAFARLGLDVKDLDPRLRSLDSIFEDLNTNGFGASEAFEAFGLRGGPAALVLSNLLGNFRELNKEITESEGIAQAFADRINDTLRGSILRLKSAYEEFLISQGGLAKGFRDGVDVVRQTIEALNGTLNPLEEGAKAANQYAVVLKRLLPVLAAVGVAFAVLAGLVVLATAGLGVVAAAAAIGVAGLVAVDIAVNNANAEFERFNNTMLATDAIFQRIAKTEAARAAAQAAASLPGATKKDRDALALAVGDDLAITGDIEAQLIAQQNLIKQQEADIVANLERQAEIQRLASQPTFLSPDGQLGNGGSFEFSGSDLGNELADLKARIPALRDYNEQLSEELFLLKFKTTIRKIELAQIDNLNRARKELAAKSIADANEINQVLNSLSGKRTTQISSLKDEIKVLKAELDGGAAGKLAAQIEKLRQAAGFSGEEADERGVQSARLLERINSQLAVAQKNLAAASTGTNQATIDSAEAAVVAQQRNLDHALQVIEAAKKQQTEINRLAQIQADYTTKIDDGRKARQEAEAAVKKQQATERSFERFRITQLAKLQEEIILQGTANDERVKAAAAIKLVTRASAAGVEVNQEWIDSLFQTIDALEEASGAADGFFEGFAKGAQDFIDDAATFAENGAELFKNTFKSLEDELVGFVETGKFSFRSLGETIRSTLLRQGIRNVIQGTLGAIPGLSPKDSGDSAQQAVVSQLLLIQSELKASPKAVQTSRTNTLLLAIDASIRNLGGISGVSNSPGIQLPLTGGPLGGASGGFFDDPVGNTFQSVFDGAGGTGGITDRIMRARTGGKIPSFRMGGDTRKALGLDREEIPAILHPNEAVIPLTRDGRVPLDIVNGLPEVRLPGTGRSIRTATDAPAKAAQVNAITQAATSANESVRGGSKNVSPLAFFGAPGFLTGSAGVNALNTGGGFDIGGGFGDSLLSGFGSVLSGIADIFRGIDFSAILGESFEAITGFFGKSGGGRFGGLFGGDGSGSLSGLNELFTGVSQTAGGDTAAGLNTSVEQLSPGAQINQGFDKVVDTLPGFSGGAFTGFGFENAPNSEKPLGLQDPTKGLQPSNLTSVSPGLIPPELSGIGDITEGARRALEDIPVLGRLFKQNEETGKTPFGQVASAAIPIGLSLLISQFSEQGGKRGKSSFRPSGRVVGFNDAGGEEVELTKEEKRLLEQLSQGRKSLGGGGKKGVSSGNIPAFAQGGIVNGPTLALVGERTPEAIIPLAGGAVPVRVSGGQQTGKVITNNVNFSIITPNADSFREAQSQIQASTAASIGRATQRQS